jgi:hypothetical protein
MSENEKPKVDANSIEFNQGVEAGLNSKENTQNWQAGNKLGQQLKNETQTERPFEDVPLFLRGGSEGRKGNTQDEKDEMGE